MKHLRQYIRQLLQEDLGKQVWADRAPRNSLHYGTEWDTRVEEDLYNVLSLYLGYTIEPIVNSDMIDDIKEYMHDPRYKDVFIEAKPPSHNPNALVLRGQVVSKKHLEKFIDIPSYDASKMDRYGYRIFDIDLTYTSAKWERSGLTSSWTYNSQVARDFSFGVPGEGGFNEDTNFAVVFHAKITPDTFLDLEEMYNWRMADGYAEANEEELLALGPVQVKKIAVYYPEAFANRIGRRW